ncbi:S-layer homology domain-containing protein [Peptoniphilus equinus]|uniref:S-layer homology domain-containing protein n=1 Tax=Peptoniphilus equinus TaxID=3016343 RepID=A0ABY7QWH0_9FIRM|nr:S-layer homology domain-containing protein [Peptoniphilus equinus]WBW50248.1 S-layer homology domain-containing protein [Peptoniphilus equinus]
MKKKLIIASLAACLVASCMGKPIFAADIGAVLEQPAVSEAVVGDTLTYNLVITVPQDEYHSFAVTLLLDEKLSLDSSELVGVQAGEGIILKNSKVNNQNIVSLSVNDIMALNGVSSFSVALTVKAAQASEDGRFNNSVVLTSQKLDGTENSSQKNLTTSASVTETKQEITVNPIQTEDELLTGTTVANAEVAVYLGDNLLGSQRSYENGVFEIPLVKQPLGTKLTVTSTYVESGKKKVDTKTVVVQDGEGEAADRPIDIGVLEDYTLWGEGMKIKNASREDLARMNAATSLGRFVLVQSDRTNKDIQDALEKIKDAAGYLRVPYMQGYWDKTFKPESPMTRGEVAQVLSTIYLKKAPSGHYSTFKDVKQTDWYADAVGFMEEKGFMGGYYDGTFKPDAAITRAEFAAVLYKFYGEPYGHMSTHYDDVKESHWAKDAIDFVAGEGYMTGRSDTVFAESYPITRAECAKVLNTILGRVPNQSFMDKYSKNPFSDVDAANWAYYHVLEITGN